MKTLVLVSYFFQIPQQTLISAAKANRIPAQKIGRDWFVDDESPEFLEFVKKWKINVEKKSL